MDVWITKYALTSGVFVADVERCESINPKMVSGFGRFRGQYYHKPDWHETEDEALARVREMIVSRIGSLKASIRKVEAVETKLKERGLRGIMMKK